MRYRDSFLTTEEVKALEDATHIWIMPPAEVKERLYAVWRVNGEMTIFTRHGQPMGFPKNIGRDVWNTRIRKAKDVPDRLKIKTPWKAIQSGRCDPAVKDAFVLKESDAIPAPKKSSFKPKPKKEPSKRPPSTLSQRRVRSRKTADEMFAKIPTDFKERYSYARFDPSHGVFHILHSHTSCYTLCYKRLIEPVRVRVSEVDMSCVACTRNLEKAYQKEAPQGEDGCADT